jgi:hypothetical protein
MEPETDRGPEITIKCRNRETRITTYLTPEQRIVQRFYEEDSLGRTGVGGSAGAEPHRRARAAAPMAPAEAHQVQAARRARRW